ncbi:uncharacterized protein LOC121853762 [Homarus americanus]|uniref:uncharacterized protein LOC121853762 n=1 Tax=Homarus americanus TaxID=6706 RepID=UPI001C479632|nr:uncharacterized protein LOC121853762 [Homarus americanus]
MTNTRHPRHRSLHHFLPLMLLSSLLPYPVTYLPADAADIPPWSDLRGPSPSLPDSVVDHRDPPPDLVDPLPNQIAPPLDLSDPLSTQDSLFPGTSESPVAWERLDSCRSPSQVVERQVAWATRVIDKQKEVIRNLQMRFVALETKIDRMFGCCTKQPPTP